MWWERECPTIPAGRESALRIRNNNNITVRWNCAPLNILIVRGRGECELIVALFFLFGETFELPACSQRRWVELEPLNVQHRLSLVFLVHFCAYCRWFFDTRVCFFAARKNIVFLRLLEFFYTNFSQNYLWCSTKNILSDCVFACCVRARTKIKPE